MIALYALVALVLLVAAVSGLAAPERRRPDPPCGEHVGPVEAGRRLGVSAGEAVALLRSGTLRWQVCPGCGATYVDVDSIAETALWGTVSGRWASPSRRRLGPWA